jgi:hypothetical protein
MHKLFKRFLVPASVLVIAMFGTQVSAFSLTGIPTSGTPVFGNSVKVTLNSANGSLKLRGSKDFLFADGVNPTWMGTGSKYNVDVSFNKNTGAFQGGTLTLRGAIAGLEIYDKRTVLVTADITDWNVTENQWLWGFKTENIVCSPLLLISCTPSESIYVELDEAFTAGDVTGNSFRSTGFAHTTVPVPAAAWLFGSALGFLGWAARKRQPGLNAAS